jgi:4-amino-4-deoxy-L-arabinose transferase-like glycosyltransferase
MDGPHATHALPAAGSLSREARDRARVDNALCPALLVLALTLGVVLVRPPLPIDETRYLEVFRESLGGSPLLLRLLGEPYAEKTPLLFWLGRVLSWFSISPEVALRLVPGLVSACTVLVVARLGARVGARLAGWVQAALWIPLLAGQFLHFDPLLSLAVWSAIDAWVARRQLRFGIWSALALFAKGPVGLLFLVPFLWAMQPLRGTERGDLRRASLTLGLAFVPLAAWAVAAALRGGPEFANALLWERWAGRIGKGAAHSHSTFFYLPVALLGALPGTLVLFRRERDVPAWIRRLGRSLLAVLVAFTLIRGKQAHYLVPAAPGLALWLAWRLEHEPRALARLRAGVRIETALLACLPVAGAIALPRIVDSVSTSGRELLADGGARWPLAVAGAGALAGLVATFRTRASARALLLIAVASSAATFLPVHRLAGELLYPHALAAVLGAERDAPIAYLGSAQHGIYSLLAARDDLEKLQSEAELETFCADDPGGLLLIEADSSPASLPEHLVVVATDVVHRNRVQVLRIDDERRGADAAR